MHITQMTRFKSSNSEEIAKAAKTAKGIFEKHGAEFLRLTRFHAGTWAGEWLVVSRYTNWEVYGKAMEGVSKDADYTKLMAHMGQFAELMGRSITVGYDL
jgi:hypothetical protein